jgi:hypothetical protein
MKDPTPPAASASILHTPALVPEFTFLKQNGDLLRGFEICKTTYLPGCEFVLYFVCRIPSYSARPRQNPSLQDCVNSGAAGDLIARSLGLRGLVLTLRHPRLPPWSPIPPQIVLLFGAGKNMTATRRAGRTAYL